MARGRPVSNTQLWEFQVHLRLRAGEDDDLIAFFRQIPARKRVSAIKSALRSGGMGSALLPDSISDDELLSSLDDFLK
jgi:hypothetical protein